MSTRMLLGRCESSRPIASTLIAAPVLLLAASARAQQPLYVLHGQFSGAGAGLVGSELGNSVAVLSDLNGDGIPELVSGDTAQSYYAPMAGHARVFSGADGAVLFDFTGDAAYESYASSVGNAGDVDADGFDDVVVSSAYVGSGDTNGAAQVRSGHTGAVLRTFLGEPVNVGNAVSTGVGDVNSDGHGEVLVALPYSNVAGASSGHVLVYDGASGNLLYDIPGPGPGAYFGIVVDAAGDMDADGKPEFVVASVGPTRVYSGATGSLLLSFTTNSTSGNSAMVRALGDVNGDGKADLVVGAGDDTQAPGGGRVDVRSGSNGTVLYSVYGQTPSGELGWTVGSGGDYDGDGHADFMATQYYDPAAGPNRSSVALYSGVDGHLLRKFLGTEAGDGFGYWIGMLGDANQDGLPDAYSTAPYSNLSRGAIYVLSVGALISNYCSASTNSTGSAAAIHATGHASLAANDLLLNADHLPASRPGLFIASSTQGQAPFGNGVLCLGGQIQRLLPVQFSSPSGVLASALDVTQGPWPTLIHPGTTWNFQGWFRDPAAGGAGFNFSDGLSVTFLP